MKTETKWHRGKSRKHRLRNEQIIVNGTTLVLLFYFILGSLYLGLLLMIHLRGQINCSSLTSESLKVTWPGSISSSIKHVVNYSLNVTLHVFSLCCFPLVNLIHVNMRFYHVLFISHYLLSTAISIFSGSPSVYDLLGSRPQIDNASLVFQNSGVCDCVLIQ